MRSKTFLFFPVEIGLAHLVRSVAVAEAVKHHGHTAIIAIPKRKQALFTNTSVDIIDISPLYYEDSIDFIHTLTDTEYIARLSTEERKIILAIKPDCIINDFRITVFGSSAGLDIPLAMITGSGGLPYGCVLPNPGISSFIFSLIQPMAQRCIWRMKSRYLRHITQQALKYDSMFDLNQVIRSMCYIIPEPVEYLPSLKTLHTVYTGSIHWETLSASTPPWLSHIKPTGSTIYLTFGGTGFDRKKFITLAWVFVKKGFTVIVSTGSIANPSDFPTHENLYVTKFLPGAHVAKRVDLVVCHGGYGTMTQAVSSGTPVLAIPYNPDQILHSWRFQELGFGKTMTGFRMSILKDLVRADWKHIENMGKNISVDSIVDTAATMLSDVQTYKQAIHHSNLHFHNKNATKIAARAIINHTEERMNKKYYTT